MVAREGAGAGVEVDEAEEAVEDGEEVEGSEVGEEGCWCGQGLEVGIERVVVVGGLGGKFGERLYFGDSALRPRFMLELGTDLHPDMGF